MANTADATRILLGRIAGAHGIRGEVVIHAFTSTPEDIGAYGPLQDRDGARQFVISGARATAKGVVARIKGVSDRNAAEALKGTELYVARESLPPADVDEYYHADLVGLAAIDPAGQPVGEIITVQNFGAGDLLEIRLVGSHKTEFIPFTEAHVPQVDVAARRVVVVMPAGDDADRET